MKPAQNIPGYQKILSEVQLARIRFAKAKNEFVSSREQARLAKRRRRESKEAARRAKRQARLAKKQVAQAELLLVETEARLAHWRKSTNRTNGRKRTKANVVSGTPSKNVARRARPSKAKITKPESRLATGEIPAGSLPLHKAPIAVPREVNTPGAAPAAEQGATTEQARPEPAQGKG